MEEGIPGAIQEKVAEAAARSYPPFQALELDLGLLGSALAGVDPVSPIRTARALHGVRVTSGCSSSIAGYSVTAVSWCRGWG